MIRAMGMMGKHGQMLCASPEKVASQLEDVVLRAGLLRLLGIGLLHQPDHMLSRYDCLISAASLAKLRSGIRQSEGQ